MQTDNPQVKWNDKLKNAMGSMTATYPRSEFLDPSDDMEEFANKAISSAVRKKPAQPFGSAWDAVTAEIEPAMAEVNNISAAVTFSPDEVKANAVSDILEGGRIIHYQFDDSHAITDDGHPCIDTTLVVVIRRLGSSE